MTTNECVIDVELFGKISSDEQFEYISAYLQNKMKCGEFNIDDYDECHCFIDLLKAVKNNHCILGINDSILKDYIEAITKCPREIREIYRAISSMEHCFKEVDEIDSRKTEHFIGSPLEPKIDYIAVAHLINPKIIVSTMRSIDQEYATYSEKLDALRVCCISSCKAKNEILFK